MHISRMILSATAVCVAAAPAQASDARILLSAFVPIRCEMSFTPSLGEVGGISTLGTIRQYCNTRYQMRFSHQPLSANAVLGFGNVTAPASSGSTLIEPNGKPTIAASNLWLANGDEDDAEKFASSVVIEITPVGF
ncbi:hypothetical protein [Sphingopyxis granuli]|uniref:hypothetical protein n=1 Tax=Sphingopyxis granuli TaxID=267128 RepID=UPI00155E71F4|nr:hypothetical protein [Sphingopyxis granuli]